MTIGQNAIRTKAAMLAAATLTVPLGVWAGPAGTYYERSFVVAADARCDLFQPHIGAALTAATAQARSAALRSGARATQLNSVAARAHSRAGAVRCSDPELTIVRRRVDIAFDGWARTPRMTFPGKRRAWIADRTALGQGGWRLRQTSSVGASSVAFGYVGKGASSRLATVVSFVGRSRPYAARVVLRDTAKSPRAWLGGGGLAPIATQHSVWATGVSDADKAWLSKGRRSGEAWTFPASATALLEQLDPRESFAIEFHFRDGSVATSRFEAGDFAVGRAFLAMGAV